MDDQTHKLILIGDSGVGKTALINRHRTGEFQSEYVPTVGVNITPLSFHTNKGNIVFDICDVVKEEVKVEEKEEVEAVVEEESPETINTIEEAEVEKEKFIDLFKIIDEHNKTVRENHIKGIDILKEHVCVDIVNTISSYYDWGQSSEATCAIIMYNPSIHLAYWNSLSLATCIYKKFSSNISIIVCGNKENTQDPRIVLTNMTYRHDNQDIGIIKWCEISTELNHDIEKPFLILARHFHGQDTQFICPP